MKTKDTDNSVTVNDALNLTQFIEPPLPFPPSLTVKSGVTDSDMFRTVGEKMSNGFLMLLRAGITGHVFWSRAQLLLA